MVCFESLILLISFKVGRKAEYSMLFKDGKQGCSKAVLHRLGKQDDYNNHTVKDVKYTVNSDAAAASSEVMMNPSVSFVS